jgi:hypothetical protein
MFRLTSQNLSNKVNNKLAPVFIIWKGDYRQTAPILQVNCYASWWMNPGWELENIALEVPFAIGKLYKLHSIPKAKQISLWETKTDAVSSMPDTFWQYKEDIYLYQRDLEIPAFFIAEIEVATPANYTIELIEGFVANTITSEGLIFTIGNEAGNFNQVDNILTVYTNEQISLEVNQKLLITGEFEFGQIEYLSDVVSFHLPEIEYLDRIEWAGHNFSPSKIAGSPKLWEFTWNKSNHIANLFLAHNSLPYFEELSVNKIAEISGIINFDR